MKACNVAPINTAAVAAELQDQASPSLAGIRQPGQEGDAEKENGCSVASNSMVGPAVHSGTDTGPRSTFPRDMASVCGPGKGRSEAFHMKNAYFALRGLPLAGPAGGAEGPPKTRDSQNSAVPKAHQKKRLRAEQQLEVVAEPTEYAKSRPRRERQEPRMALGHTSESLELLACQDFVGPPGSGAPQAQPFRVSVNPQVPSTPLAGSAPVPEGEVSISESVDASVLGPGVRPDPERSPSSQKVSVQTS